VAYRRTSVVGVFTMSWLKTTNCPICGVDGFDPDCDEVDIGVGVQEFNLRGICPNCDEVEQCQGCGMWLNRDSDHQHCPGEEG
jgi:hypothetical protein